MSELLARAFFLCKSSTGEKFPITADLCEMTTDFIGKTLSIDIRYYDDKIHMQRHALCDTSLRTFLEDAIEIAKQCIDIAEYELIGWKRWEKGEKS